MEAGYLRVKDWAKLQHYSKRRPLFIKLYARLLLDDRFNELGDVEQLQLTKLWLVASQSSRFTVDREANRVVPVIPFDQKTLRSLTRSRTKIRLETLVNQGWLVPVFESELIDSATADCVNYALFEVSAASRMLASGYQDARDIEQRKRKKDQVLLGLEPVENLVENFFGQEGSAA